MRDDIAKGLRETRANDALFVLRIEADDAVNRLGSIDRVQRRKDQMARLRCLHRDLCRLEVTHLADENHFRRLPQCGAQS